MPRASSALADNSHTVLIDVAVLGGGVIGLATAWRAAQAGLATCVIDPEPGSGASGVAAGMLAPVTEAHFGEEALLSLNLASAAMYPAFVAELEAESGLQVGYRACGTLAVAADADDWAVLERLARYQAEQGLSVTSLSAREARRAEPALSPAIRGAMSVEGDHQVDNRRLHAALAEAARRRGVRFISDRATRLIASDAGVKAIELGSRGRVETGQVVVAMGAWSGRLEGMPASDVVPVRPVKGQILRLAGPAQPTLLNGNIRALVKGGGVYFVPRSDGEIVVGATMEEAGFDTAVTAGAVHDLLRYAHATIPGMSELVLAECAANLRPGTPDNSPIIGPGLTPGLVMATGHYRNGILLTPITAAAVAEHLVSGRISGPAGAFGPGRFRSMSPTPTGRGQPSQGP